MKKLFLPLTLIGAVAIVFVIFIFGGAEKEKNYQAPPIESVTEESYDTIVIGGEPEGVAAAVSAARNGSKTLLVAKRDGLGGLMTYGMLNYIDMVYGIDNKKAIGGIFAEWHKMVGGKDAFAIDKGKQAFLDLVLAEENLTLMLETDLKDAIVEEGKVASGAVLERNGETFKVTGNKIIDATQSANYAVMAGAPYYKGGGDLNMPDRKMAVTLMIHLKGIDWDGIRKAAKNEVLGPAGLNETVAWGFGELHYAYKPVEKNTRLRGLNIARIQKDDGPDQFYINALQIFGVDGTNQEDIEKALAKGERETKHIVDFLRKNLPGFKNAEIASIPDELYIRETRHIKSEYMLQMSDVWTNSDFWDGIAYGGYPVDVQATSINDYGQVVASPTQYSIPFRSTVPLEVENLLVVSRSAGYSSLAAGSARIIPTGMAVGEAGGVAAALANEHNVTFREMSENEGLVGRMRNQLMEQGAKVKHFDIGYPYEGKWYDESLQFLLNYGLIAGGYDNNLHVEENLDRNHMRKVLQNGLYRGNMEAYKKYAQPLKDNLPANGSNGKVFTRDGLASYLIKTFTGKEPSAHPWDQALDLGLIDDTIHSRLAKDQVLKRMHGYYIAAEVLQNYIETKENAQAD
ncbi:FAD-dependent oxidoreductase [Thalassobacillus pellis]|uniref:FAD-dependent oxidoreductase n=1 Tax=Thalassobacillus pellis TaxID=748008 RepID=UPI00196045EF|nr:FAD-dependent oxidoreductase [Thalassobacillus pellis]MBM7551680.1 hypothetical protein [Thalassobacillus pellis]